MIVSERHGEIHLLRLGMGKGNLLDGPRLAALADEVEGLAADLPRGLVWTGEGASFCAGLDLPRLAGADREAMSHLLSQLYRVCEGLFSFPRPVVAALNGHATGAGAFLSLAADRRLMVQGEGKWGLGEGALGLSLPAFGVEMARYALPRTVLERLLYRGELYPAFKALDMGILDDLVDREELLERSREAVLEWTASPEAFADIKRRLHAPALAAMRQARGDEAPWLGLWFGPTVQGRLRTLSREPGSRP